MYLLDTDILSNLLKRTPSTTLIAALASIPPEQQFTSSITLGELIYGAYRLGPLATIIVLASPSVSLRQYVYASQSVMDWWIY